MLCGNSNGLLTIVANVNRSAETAIFHRLTGLTSQAEFIRSDFLSISQQTIKTNSGSSLIVVIKLNNY
jgi:hypothetical protein